ncbi:MAG: hypothetical protein GXO48_05935 [Chlorobi bacterium]|nr:hypothetical protein [Chlorobiota bacterium]
MRKLTLIPMLILGVASLTFTGCSKDKKMERKLRGEWNVKGKSIKENTQKATINMEATINGKCKFNKNHTGHCDYAVNMLYEYKDSLDQFSMTFTEYVSLKISDWTVEGDILYITYEDGTQEAFIIVEMKDDYFHLKPYDNQAASMEFTMLTPDGDLIKFSFKYELEMTRI